MMFGSNSGRGFGGTINYDLDLNGLHDKDVRILVAEGVDVYYNGEGHLDADSRQLSRSFRAQAMMNPDVEKCVKHVWMSYKPEDQLVMVNNAFDGEDQFKSYDDAVNQLGQQRVNDITDKAMIEDSRRLLRELKYDQTQLLIVRHSEKDNPHVHIILNMVDNEGHRLKDFQEKKRGFMICRQITLDRNYTWGDHKSKSKTVSNRPKDRARAAICKEILDITQNYFDAVELFIEARNRGIEVKYRTNYETGEITGLSFSKDGFLFPAAKVDASLSAKKLFPSQEKSATPLSHLPVREQDTVKAGGVVRGFNDQILEAAEVPNSPKAVQEAITRKEYHKAIDQADRQGNRIAYIENIAGLALDPKCGPPEKRAEALSSYIIDEQPDMDVELQRILEIVLIADRQAREKKHLYTLYVNFLQNLVEESLCVRKYAILIDQSRKELGWEDLRSGVPGMLVGIAKAIHEYVEKAISISQERAKERHKAPEVTKNRVLSEPSLQKGSQKEYKSKGIKK